MLSALAVGKYFFSPFVFLLKKKEKREEKKKAIWYQIHSWHITKGSTEKMSLKIKSKTTAVYMELCSPEFQCSQGSERTNKLTMVQSRKSRLRRTNPVFQVRLLSVYHCPRQY